MEERAPLRVWFVLAAGLAVLGTSAILIRYASDAPGVVVAAWRTVFASVLLAPVAWLKAGPEIRALPRRDALLISVAGLLLGLHFIAWTESLYHTSVASASVLVTTSPLFIAILGYFVLREHLGVRTVLAILAAVGGAALIGGADATVEEFPRALLGNGLAVSAALLFAVYLLIGRTIRRRTTLLAYLMPLFAVAAVTCIAGALLQGAPMAQPPKIIGLCLLMALGPQLIGHTSFNYAVRYLPAALIGLLTLTEPIGASILAMLLFAEFPSALALIGMLVVMSAIAVVLVRKGPTAGVNDPPTQSGELKRLAGSESKCRRPPRK